MSRTNIPHQCRCRQLPRTLSPHSSAILVALFVPLIFYQGFVLVCDARIDARIQTSSSPSMSPIAMQSNATHYFKDHFNITGVLYRLTQHDVDTCTLPASAIQASKDDEGRATNLETRGCQGLGVIGAVYVFDVSPMLAGFSTHVTEERARPSEYYPVVALAGGGPAQEWLLGHVNSGDVLVTITSGDTNDFSEVLTSILWKLWSFAISCHSFANANVVIDKLLMFAGGSKEFPRLILLVLIPELFANMFRFLNCLDMSLFRLHLFPYEIMRPMMSLPITLSIVSTLGIAIVIYDIYRNANNSDSSSNRRRYMFSRLLISIVASILCLDIFHTLYAVVIGNEIISTSLTGAFYTVLQIPVSIVFIRFGRSTARMLLKHKHSFSASEQEKRRQFSRRVMFSGFAMVMSIVSLVSFVSFNDQSATAWLYLYSGILMTANSVASFQIAAVRTPERLSAKQIPAVIKPF